MKIAQKPAPQPEPQSKEYLLVPNIDNEPGYSLLLYFPNWPGTGSATLILEAPFLPDGRVRFLVSPDRNTGDLYYKPDHWLTARVLCLALNIIEHHKQHIVSLLGR